MDKNINNVDNGNNNISEVLPKDDIVIAVEVNDVLNLREDVMKCIELKQVPYTYNNSGYQGGYNGSTIYRNTHNEPKDDRTVYFYEFSNVNSLPKVFYKVSEFLKWARECHISITSYQEDLLKTNPCSYCSCYKSSSSVAVKQTLSELKTIIEPYVSPVYRGHRGSYPRDYDYYNDWD